jgi:sugar/nucleoside kinase (ribokinase family)
VTSWGAEIALGPVASIPVVNFATDRSTTFENIMRPGGRVQILHHVAPTLEFYHVPQVWRQAPIVHLGPIAQEVEPGLVRNFPDSLIGITPQGWLRQWDQQGHVTAGEWPEAAFVLEHSGAAVLSLEDVGGDERRIEEMAESIRILAITEAGKGSRLFWNGDVRRFRAPEVTEIDATGAGDIYAAAFFARLLNTRDPWEAARFATHLASFSVTRPGLAGIPTIDEIEACTVEVL